MSSGPNALADRLNHLFRTVHPRGRRPYSNEEVAEAIRAEGGDISRQYIAYLRNGQRNNPRLHHLKALAKFFGVNAGYFFDDDEAARTDAKLRELVGLRESGADRGGLPDLQDAGITRVAVRAVGLSPQGLDLATGLLDQLRRMEHLPPSDADAG
ncbi:helix-turn-helix domain-containing protein [Streptomyces sp. URMC 127]|uniref:helix-turn-helix domain-containing protein n=1 Tax=Streptomyces sp. URMC 127 TaxID=3423402 RepID=UPI003F1DF4F2